MPELPYVSGSEVAGELDGRRVLAFTRVNGGGYAERVAVDLDWTFALPDGASFAAGASFLLTYLTAYIPLHRQTRVTPVSTVLVHAGSGGVGSAAVQLAKNLGARVIVTASTAEKRAAALANGADEALSYDELDEVRADVVIDPVGGDVFTRSLSLLNPLGVIVAVGFANGLWQDPSVQWLVGRNAGVVGIYLGAPDEAATRVRTRVRARAARHVDARRDRPGGRRAVPTRRGRGRARVDRRAQARGEGRPRAVKALVTGGAGGIGRAIVVRLEAEGYDVESLDLVDGFDVTSAAAWAEVGPVDIACLNAGVLTGETDIRALTDVEYRRAVGVNVDGVVFGVRRLAQVMPEGAIVVTASLAGLTGMPSDAIYSLTKHALVGFVRSVAQQLAPVTINAVCPGYRRHADDRCTARRLRGGRVSARRARGSRRGRLAGCHERLERGRLVRAAGARAGSVPLSDAARALGRRARGSGCRRSSTRP